jgi:DNA end-binding protein Ku
MRALWSGSLSFGLINIPVRLYTASRDRALKFHLLDKDDHCPISYTKVCRSDNRVISQKDIVKGYEYEKGKYVVLTDEDFKRANARKSELIEIISFADEQSIDPKYFDKPYFIEPDKKASKAYVLLREALQQSKKVGIAKFVLREREHIGAVKVDDRALMLIELRFEDELVEAKGLNIPAKAQFSEKEVAMAKSLIDHLSEPFKASDYKDTYTDELKKVIEAKAKGQAPKKRSTEPQISPTQVNDILAMLKKSLEQSGASR